MDEISYSNYHKKYIRRIWYTYAICIIAAPLFILAIRVNFLNLFGSLPSLYTLENPKTDFSSELYSADRVL